MTEAQEQRRLFDEGVVALAKIGATPTGLYACPLCLKGWNLNDLTREHVPPQALGGGVLCLTCVRCNNEAGYSVDAAMVEEWRMGGLARADGTKLRVTAALGDHKLRADIVRDATGIEIKIVGERSSPSSVQAMREGLGPNTELTLQQRSAFSRREADLGYLRAAYLMAFAELGYRWASSRPLDSVRIQLLSLGERKVVLPRLHVRVQAPALGTILRVVKPVACLGVHVLRSVVFLPLGGPALSEIHGVLAGAAVKGIGSVVVNGTRKCSGRQEFALDFGRDAPFRDPTADAM